MSLTTHGSHAVLGNVEGLAAAAKGLAAQGGAADGGAGDSLLASGLVASGLVTATATVGTMTIDETPGTQNAADTEDSSGNDVAGGLGTLISFVPEFDALLAEVVGVNVEPSGVSVSNANADNSTGASLLTNLGDNVTNIAFTDASGDPLNGTDSGLATVDGTTIFLYSYQGADLPGIDETNVVFGRKGTWNGTEYVADPSGDVVFAAYLQPTGAGDVALASDTGASGAKVWLVEYEALFHPDATNPDDAVSPSDVLYVTIDQNSSFSLEGAPSGQNLFLMYGDSEVALVTTGKSPSTTGHVTEGDTVNTGQGGGGTTLGSNNQMIDPGEGMYFTFVTGADPNFTVPNLDQNEADVEGNILFTGVHGSTSASFKVVQTQPASKAGTLQLSAFTTAAEPGVGYIAGLTGDSAVDISSVVVKNALGAVIETYGDTDDDNLTITITDGVATIIGVKAGYTIEYQTDGEHNRVLIENTGTPNTKTGADFDIGDFSIPRPVTETVPFNALVFEDDGPVLANAVVSSEVDEDGLPGGNPGGAGDLDADDGVNDDNDGDETTASGNISGLFVGGADGLASFGLSEDPLDIASLPQGLTSKGDAVTYAVLNNKLTASAGGREIFTLEITNTATGAYLFTLSDQLDHPTVDTEDELNLELGAILQATDGDGDKATAEAGDLVITVDDDTPDPLEPGDITVHNSAGASANAALGYFGNVGADEDGTVKFVGGTDGDVLQGTIHDGTPALDNLLFDGLEIRLYGFGTDTLTGTTNIADPSATVFVMTLNPDGSVEANDLYDITMYKTIANTQDVDFGSFVAKVASGNPSFKLVENIGGSEVDALFSGWLVPSGTQETVNIATVGVGVGNGQDFNAGDRMQIQFLKDDGGGNSVVTDAEEQVVNRFTFVMNQNNPPHDDGDLTIRVYDANGNEIQITGILINGETLVGAGGAPVDSNDDNGTVTASANGLGYDLHGLGGGTGGSTADNDTVTVIAAGGYVRIDVIGTGADSNKDTFDILLKSVAIPVAYDIDFSVQAQLADEDSDTSAAADLDVTLDADGVFAAASLVGISGLSDPVL